MILSITFDTAAETDDTKLLSLILGEELSSPPPLVDMPAIAMADDRPSEKASDARLLMPPMMPVEGRLLLEPAKLLFCSPSLKREGGGGSDDASIIFCRAVGALVVEAGAASLARIESGSSNAGTTAFAGVFTISLESILTYAPSFSAAPLRSAVSGAHV